MQRAVFKEENVDATRVSMCDFEVVQSELMKLLSDMLIWANGYNYSRLLMARCRIVFVKRERQSDGKLKLKHRSHHVSIYTVRH